MVDDGHAAIGWAYSVGGQVEVAVALPFELAMILWLKRQIHRLHIEKNPEGNVSISDNVQ